MDGRIVAYGVAFFVALVAAAALLVLGRPVRVGRFAVKPAFFPGALVAAAGGFVLYESVRVARMHDFGSLVVVFLVPVGLVLAIVGVVTMAMNVSG